MKRSIDSPSILKFGEEKEASSNVHIYSNRGVLKIQDQQPVSPLWPLIGFAAAALFGFVVLPLAARDSIAELSGNSAYRTWQILVVLQASLWIFGASYAIGIWRRAPMSLQLPLSSLAAIFLLWVLTILPYLIALRFPTANGFDWSQSRVVPRGFLASGLGVLASVIVGAGIIRIHALANDWLSSSQEHLASYREISSYLEKHLLLLGGILAGAVMGTSALREAVFSLGGAYPFPAEQVWQLAIYWSALLAVVYMAARSSVRRIGYRLRDTLLSTSAPVEEDTQRLKREEELGKFLGLNRSYVEELQSAFSVLTPLAGAAASHLAVNSVKVVHTG